MKQGVKTGIIPLKQGVKRGIIPSEDVSKRGIIPLKQGVKTGIIPKNIIQKSVVANRAITLFYFIINIKHYNIMKTLPSKRHLLEESRGEHPHQKEHPHEEKNIPMILRERNPYLI